MRFLLTAALAAALAAPSASAQTLNGDTYKAIVEHGVVMNLYGTVIEVKFLPTGRFTADGEDSGVYRFDGDKLCSTPDVAGAEETCAVYPAGKKSGDSFDVTFTVEGVTAAVNIRIL